MTTLRVLCYNIRGGLGMDGNRNTSRIAEIAQAQHPDIACFQEVHQRLPWSGWGNQPGELKSALQMPLHFSKAFGYFAGGYGVAIATRLPITQVTRHKLPGYGEPRIALQVTVTWNHAPLSVFCTHWGLSETDRKAQAHALANAVKASPHAAIVCGDLNETAGSAAVHILLTQGNLQDAGAVSNLLTYPSDTPRARIDFILHAPALQCEKLFTVPTLASDHVPVVADFTSVA